MKNVFSQPIGKHKDIKVFDAGKRKLYTSALLLNYCITVI
jgi:hypothetical protein